MNAILTGLYRGKAQNSGNHLIDQAYTLFGMPDEVYADLRKQREDSSGIDNFQVCLYYADKKAILSAGELVAMPGPHFMVHGRKGSFIKYGQDVQESRLLCGLLRLHRLAVTKNGESG